MYMFPIYLSSSEACFHPLIESPKPVVSFMYHPICFFAYAESLFHIQLSDSFEQFPLIAHYFGSSILTGLHLLPIVLALLVLTLLSFFLSHCYCLPTRCLSFSPGFLACYNCLFSCRFFFASVAVLLCSLISCCEAISISFVCMFSQTSVCTTVLQALLFTVLFPSMAFSPFFASYQIFIFGLTLHFSPCAISQFEFLYYLRSLFTFHTLHLIEVYLFISN